jgi:hypothetical protein
MKPLVKRPRSLNIVRKSSTFCLERVRILSMEHSHPITIERSWREQRQETERETTSRQKGKKSVNEKRKNSCFSFVSGNWVIASLSEGAFSRHPNFCFQCQQTICGFFHVYSLSFLVEDWCFKCKNNPCRLPLLWENNQCFVTFPSTWNWLHQQQQETTSIFEPFFCDNFIDFQCQLTQI